MEEHRVGLSLSFCIQDIIKGKAHLDEVEFIMAGTKIRNLDDVEKIAELYSEVYWVDDPITATGIFFWMWFNNKIFQPRLEGLDAPMLTDGHWLQDGGTLQWGDTNP